MKTTPTTRAMMPPFLKNLKKPRLLDLPLDLFDPLDPLDLKTVRACVE